MLQTVIARLDRAMTVTTDRGLVVMRALDPRIHHVRKIYAKRMDPRVKARG